MAETNLTNKTHQITNFRNETVAMILNAFRWIGPISHSSQVLAVSILDKYCEGLENEHGSQIPSKQLFTAYAAGCLMLGTKWNGTDEPIFQKFVKKMAKDDEEKEAWVDKILEAEGQTFRGIDFSVPMETCFDHLQKTIKSSRSSRELEIKSLKILILSLKLSPLLNKNISLASDIYNLLKNKSGTSLAISEYQKVKVFGKTTSHFSI